MGFDLMRKFGMTTTEIKVYLELSKIGENTIGPLIKRTKLHRGSVYNAIQSLTKKGFVSFVDKEGIRYYKISGERIFETIIDEKEKALVNEKKEIDMLFKEINAINEKSNEQEVSVFYSVEAFKTLFLEIYDECKKNDLEYFFQGRGGEMQDAVGEDFYKYTQRLKKKMKIKCRVILDRKTAIHPYYKYVTGDIKYLPSKIHSPVNFWVYDETVLLVLFGTTPLTTIKIKSKILSDGFRNYFENLWQIARK